MGRIRRIYLVVAIVLVVVAAAALYLRHRALEAEKALADCDMPARPARPAAPPPKLPGFTVQASCGPGETPKK